MNIGIIGGGQLGMMMAEAAKKYGYRIIGLDPNPKCSLSFIADEMIVADYKDKEAFEKLISLSDVVTYEFENVDLKLVKENIDKIPQKSKGLLISRNRLIEKKYANSLGIKTVKFAKIKSKKDIFTPSIIKTITGGYDGKGQFKLDKYSNIDHLSNIDKKEYMIEEFIEFDYEISVIATRDEFGTVVTYPIPVNSHRNGILFTSEVYDEISSVVAQKAKKYTEHIINDLDYVGTLAVEYFVKNNVVIFNEFAPRPHNSGHYSIEGCNVSQFENHVRAIAGLPVVEPVLKQPTIMLNILGQDDVFVETSKEHDVSHHDYYKKDKKHNRKMGHITFQKDTINEVKNVLSNIIKE